MAHLKFVSATGTAKTSFMNQDALLKADEGDCGIALLYPHPQKADEFLLHAEERGHGDRIVVDDQRFSRRCLSKSLLYSSRAVDFFTRKKENDDARDAFLSMPMRRRLMETLAATPMIEKYSKLAVNIYQNLDEWIPLSVIAKLLDRAHPLHKWAFGHLSDKELQWQLFQIGEMGTHDYLVFVQPAIRFLEAYLTNAHIEMVTCRPPTFHLPSHLKCCKTGQPGIYVSIGGGSAEAIQDSMCSDFQMICCDGKATISDVRRVVYLDEVVNYGLFHRWESGQLSTIRGFNIDVRLALQSYDFATKEIERNVRQNTGSIIGKQGGFEMAMEAAKDLIGFLDRNKIHHVDQTIQQFHAGNTIEERKIKDVSVSDGVKRVTDRTQFINVPQYDSRLVEKPVYEPGEAQLLWLAQELMDIPVGKFAISAGGKPSWFTLPWLDDLELSPDELPGEIAACLDRLLADDLYQEPRLWELPEMPAPAKSAAKQFTKGPRPAPSRSKNSKTSGAARSSKKT